MKRAHAVLVFAGSALLGGASLLPAQRPARIPEPIHPLQVRSVQNLRFGNVLPGIPSTVSLGEFAKVGVFEVRGPHGASVRIDFVLPAHLIGDRAGALMPLTFGFADGMASSAPYAPSGLIFNPHGPVISSLSSTGVLYLRMGGTAHPGLPQDGGEYHATISMTVYDLGS